jgi:4-hydroxy-tetrahydrodipicolinate synthase
MNHLSTQNACSDFEMSGVYERAQFGRVVTAMVTPFHERGGVNFDAAQQLAVYLQEHGSDGLVVAGTTGESATLTHTEHLDLIAAVHEAVDIPVLAGTGSNNTAESRWLSERVTVRGIADGLLVVSPYYNRPPQSGIIDYFNQVARSTNLPIVMYDIPIRTGRGMTIDTIRQLAERWQNIVGLKDAAGDPNRTVELTNALGTDFQIYSGDDALNLEFYRAGAIGAISVVAHWAAEQLQDMYRYEDRGRLDCADDVHRALQDSYVFASSEETPNPIPTKAMMRSILRGRVAVGYCRSPLTTGDRRIEDRLEERASNLLYGLTHIAD